MQKPLKTQRKRFSWLAMVLFAALLVSACGGQQPAAPAQPTPKPATPAVSQPAAPAPAPGAQAKQAAVYEKPEKTSLKLSSSVRGPGFIPMYVADAKGFWKDEGLNVEVIYFRSGEQNQQAVLGRSVDITGSAWTEPINLYVAKQPFKAFFAINNYPVYSWYAKPGIKTLDDLKGKNVQAAVSGIGSLSYIIMQWGLRKAGFPDDKVKYVPSGSAADRTAALISGQVDLITADPPSTYILDEQKLPKVLDMTKYTKEFAYEAFYAHADFIKNNPGTIKAFLKGYIRGIHHMKANPDEAGKILAKVMDMKDADIPKAIRATKELINSFPEDGVVPPAGVQFMIDFYDEIGKVGKGLTYKNFADERFIEFFKANPVAKK